MTNSWNDIKNSDLVLIMGGNAAEAHPCGFKWVTEAKANNGAKLIVVDPRFTRSAAVADVYAPIRPGTDIAFLSGVMRYLLGNNKIHQEYVKAYTNASYIVKEGYDFRDGLFTGYDESKKNYVDRSTWDYELDAGLSRPADRSRDDLRRLHEVAPLQAASAGPDQLLAELREVLRQPAEELVWRRCDQGQQLGLRLPAQVRHQLRRPEDGRHDGGGPDERPVLPGPQHPAGLAQQGQGCHRPRQAQVDGRHRSSADRDGTFLGEPRRVQRRRSQGDPDRSQPAAGLDLCR